MSLTYTQTRAVTTPAGVITGTSAQTGGGQAVLDEALEASQTKVLYNIAFPYATIKSVYILSTVAATIYTNSNSAEDDEITCPANKPITWDAADPYTCPFTADVTKFYISNTAAGTIQCYVLYDPTP